MLLALARLFVAPEPSPAPTDTGVPEAVETTDRTGTADTTAPLLLIDFRPRARTLEGSPPTAGFDLRNPFRTTTGEASVPSTAESAPKRRRANARRPDLRDPFAESTGRPRRPSRPAEDLRDPFNQPAPVSGHFGSTGGVPIQRPDTVRAGCAQASRGMVLAHR